MHPFVQAPTSGFDFLVPDDPVDIFFTFLDPVWEKLLWDQRGASALRIAIITNPFHSV